MRFIKNLLAGFVLAALLVQPSPATILFAGGEDIDFTITGTVNTSTIGSTFRTGYGRLSLQPTNSGTADPPTNRFATSVVANQTIMWLHAETNAGVNGTTLNQQAVGFYGSDSVRRLLIRGTGTSGQIKISTRNTAGTITDLSATCTIGGWPVASLTKLDIFVNYAVAGEVTIYAAGVQICDFVGDVTTNGVTAINQADFAILSGSGAISWSEIILSTTDTRSLNLMTCAPQANGTNMAWTGSFANVNGTTANDATPLTSGTSNQTAEFTCPALPAGSFSVPAVTQSGRLLRGASGPQNFRFIMRPSSGSTDFDSGSDIGLSTNFTNYSFIWATNPACSCAWTTNDITTGVNSGVVSKP